MAKIFTTGPALMYINYGSWLYLGTAESPPDIDLIGGFDPVYNDLGGTVLPFDRIYEGEEAVISFVLNRYVQASLDIIQAVIGSKTIGTDTFGDTGSIIGQEDRTFQYGMLFPYAAKALYTDMPRGYKFFSCFRIGPQGVRPGTRAKAHNLILRAQRYTTMRPGQSTTISTALTQSASILYNHDVSAFADIPIS
jgi:hypothetical protein